MFGSTLWASWNRKLIVARPSRLWCERSRRRLADRIGPPPVERRRCRRSGGSDSAGRSSRRAQLTSAQAPRPTAMKRPGAGSMSASEHPPSRRAAAGSRR